MLEQNGIKYGIIAGLGYVILTLLLYFIDPKMIFGNASMISWVIYIFCMYKSAADDKAADDGYITFRNAFQSSFVVYIIASFLGIGFLYVLMTVIDPSLIDLQIEVAMQMIEKIAEFTGMDEAALDEAVKAVEEASQPSMMQSLQGYLFGLVAGAIPALIIAAALKKIKPLHLEGNGEEDHLIEK
jgi:hypothetical protein